MKPSRTIAIVGESGSGKSITSLSLLDLLNRAQSRMDSGTFEFDTTAFHDLPSSLLNTSVFDARVLRGKQIAMIFQEPMTALNPVMRCGQQIEEALDRKRITSREDQKNQVIQLLEEVLIPSPQACYEKFPHELSGGQRQRVMIAMALAGQPKLLIADEPTTALDVTVQKEILLLLKRIQAKRGMAMIFITHDLGVVKDIADDILVINRGDVVEYGSVDEVLHHPKEKYTQALIRCKPSPSSKGIPLPTIQRIDDPITTPIHSQPSHEVLLAVSQLSKVYVKRSLFQRTPQEARAVDQVSFQLFKGETLGLVGESGCGKTTLSRMLVGLIPPSSGTIQYSIEGANHTFDQHSAASQWKPMRSAVQLIFQDPYSALNPKRTILQTLEEPMQNFGLYPNRMERERRIEELLDQVGLPRTAVSKYPHEFSGGQRQRIVIARALSCEPKFIICDESVSALDVSVQAQVLNLLNELKRDLNLTYLFITHDLNVVYYMSDRIMVMNKGRVEECDTADRVFYHPQSDYTKRLLSAVPGGGW